MISTARTILKIDRAPGNASHPWGSLDHTLRTTTQGHID